MKRFYAAVFFAAIAFFAKADVPALDISTPVGRYLELKRLFQAYDGAMFGSRPYHERMLRLYLRELIHREIETSGDYILAVPGGAQNKNVRSKFAHLRWLELIGDIDRESLLEVFSGEIDLTGGWRRSELLFSVNGRVTWARISRNPYGRSVELYFDKIKLRVMDKTAQQNTEE